MIEAQIGIPLVAAGVVAAVLLPPTLETYYHWFRNAVDYPEVSFLGLVTRNEQEVRGNARFLIGQANTQLDILSSRLSASVWDERLAEALQKRLDKKPDLKARVLTGREVAGADNGSHPFLSVCFDNPSRLSVATLDVRFPSEGIRADSNNLLRATSSPLLGKELVPAETFYRDYDNDTARTMEIYWFKRIFERLWDHADMQHPTIVAQAA